MKMKLKMALLKNTTPAFETEDNTVIVSESDKANTSVKVSEPVATTPAVKVDLRAMEQFKDAMPVATTPAVKVDLRVMEQFKAAMPVATTPAVKVDLRAMEQFKDAMPVEYNTLSQIVANSGNFMDRESKTILGDTIVFKLLSYQDSYVLSPNDDDAPDDTVKYSNDGVVCSDGTDVKAHLEFLKSNGFPKAALKQRVVLVVALESAVKSDKFNNNLVQIDLSPSSRTMWKRYMANVAYSISIGKTQPEKASRVKAETVIARNGTNTFTQVQFSQAE